MYSHLKVRSIVYSGSTAAVAQSVERSTSMRKVVVFLSRPRQTQVVQTGCDSFTAKR